MSISPDEIRGYTDTIILARLMDGDSYGYEIGKAIRTITGGLYELKEATLYTAFHRMEQAGLISSYWGESEGGARRRYYRVTEKGKLAYSEGAAGWNETKRIISELIERGGIHDA